MAVLKDYIQKGSEVLGTKGELCERLGVTRQALNKAEHVGSMDTDRCIILAGIIGINPAPIIEAASNARKPEYAKYWRVATIFTVIMSVAVMSQLLDFSGDYSAIATDVTIYYAHIV